MSRIVFLISLALVSSLLVLHTKRVEAGPLAIGKNAAGSSRLVARHRRRPLSETCGTGGAPYTELELSDGGSGPTVQTDIGAGLDGSIFEIGYSELGTVTYGVWLIQQGTGTTALSLGFQGFPAGETATNGKIAVGPDGTAIIATDSNHIYELNPLTGQWSAQFPGLARDVAITSDGTPWVVGTVQTAGAFKIYFWNGSWNLVNGAALRITGGPDSQPWVVNQNDIAYHRNSNGTWTNLGSSGGKDIGVDLLTDQPYVLIGSGEILQYNGSTWVNTGTATTFAGDTSSGITGGYVFGGSTCSGAITVGASGTFELVEGNAP